MSKEFTIQIKGASWRIRQLTPRKFKKEHDQNWAAVTLPDSKEIHFNGDNFLPCHIRHELLHAFVSESNTESMNMTPDDMEELCCSLVGEFSIDIIKIADQIISQLKSE